MFYVHHRVIKSSWQLAKITTYFVFLADYSAGIPGGVLRYISEGDVRSNTLGLKFAI